jgi:hypothetical protein
MKKYKYLTFRQSYIRILNMISFSCVMSKLNMSKNKNVHVYV